MSNLLILTWNPDRLEMDWVQESQRMAQGSGEASPTSPIGPLWSHGVTRTANTPQGRVRSFRVHVFAVSRRQRSWRCLFGFSAND